MALRGCRQYRNSSSRLRSKTGKGVFSTHRKINNFPEVACIYPFRREATSMGSMNSKFYSLYVISRRPSKEDARWLMDVISKRATQRASAHFEREKNDSDLFCATANPAITALRRSSRDFHARQASMQQQRRRRSGSKH